MERRLCFRQVRSDARSEQRRLFRYRDGVFLYAVANQPAQEGSGYLEKRARAFGGCGWLALIGTHTLRGREVRINRRAPCVQGQIRGPLLLRAKGSVRRWPPPTFSGPFFQCAIHSAPTTASNLLRKFTPYGTARSLAISGFPPFPPAGRSGI